MYIGSAFVEYIVYIYGCRGLCVVELVGAHGAAQTKMNVDDEHVKVVSVWMCVCCAVANAPHTSQGPGGLQLLFAMKTLEMKNQ